MRKTVLTIVAVAGVGLVGAGFYGLVLHEEPLATGELVEALLEEANENKLTEVFARFVPIEAGFEQQAAVLNANGFRCGVRPAYVEGNTYLSCDRPVEGTGYCRGFRYYSYQTRTGEIIETLGSAFDRRRDRNLLGRCEEIRQHFYALANEIGEIKAGAER
ncbi:hypothetical protein [Devosia submarina]|uniref:hypothetical protein n=1 Tax=Devosia submarina TaxID=1173082 RepID=UPI000D3D3141|nr:hypothetical protein [Devosia submarina]